MNRSTPGLPVHHQLLEFSQTHVHWVGDAIQPSHPLSSPSPPAPNPSQHQSLFQWVNSSHVNSGVHKKPQEHLTNQQTPQPPPSLPSAVLIHLVWSGPRWFWCCRFISHTLKNTNLENERKKKSWERWKQRGIEGSKRQSGKRENRDGGAVVQNLKRRKFAKGLRVEKRHFISISSKTWVSVRQSLYKTKIKTRSFELTLLNAQILLKNTINK